MKGIEGGNQMPYDSFLGKKKEISDYKCKYVLNERETTKFSDGLNKEFDELDGKEVYAYILLPRVVDDVIEYQMSLMTKNMMEQDARFIQLSTRFDSSESSNVSYDDKIFLQGYHPFFFEFFSEGTKEKFSFLDENIGKWVTIKIHFKSLEDKSKSKKNEGIISGDIVFGASPLKKHAGYLEFTNQANVISYAAEFNSTSDLIYQCNNVSLKTECQDLFRCTSDIYGFILNVGQANCIALNFDDIALFFDVGLSVHSCKNKIDNDCAAVAYMNKSKPKVIILSHWDIDHIIGVVEIGAPPKGGKEEEDIENNEWYSPYTNCRWIAPDISLLKNKVSVSAKRLCYYLLRQGNILLVNHKDHDSPFIDLSDSGYDKLALYQGRGGSSQGTINNNIGLILKMDHLCSNGTYQSILLAGDCAFEEMPNQIQENQFDVIVSPHHGSGETRPSFKTRDGNSRAIISVGENKWHHPRIEHIACLLQNGFHVFFTSACGYIYLAAKKGQNVHIRRLT